jgi:methane monooxygenase PmoA-like
MKLVLPVLAALLPLAPVAAGPVPVTVTRTETTVDFKVGDELVTRYHVGPDVAKPYFWPLNAPGGVPVTRGWPMQKGLPKETTDHVHQKSGWFCHGDVIPEGVELKVRSADKNIKGVDFWSEAKGHGVIACVEVSDPKPSAHAGTVATRNEWRAPDGTKILDEQRTITVRNLGDARLVVLDIDLHATVCPITFGDTKEGSMGVRVNDEFRLTAPKSDGEVAAADGTTVKAPARDNLPVWGKRSDWNDYSGSVDGKTVGIDDPRNNPRAAWHTRAYGLMAANPFGRASFPATKGELARLAKGGHLKLRYGILLHPGDAKAGKVAEHFAAFAKE